MDSNNVIRTFEASDLEGKTLEGILAFIREILIEARAEDYEDFELIWNEEDKTFTAIGVDKMSDYVIPPNSMKNILEALGFE